LVENCHFFHTPLAFDASDRGISVGTSPTRSVWKTRMAWLPGGEKNFEDIFIRLAQLTKVTDEQTDGQTPGDSIYRAYV